MSFVCTGGVREQKGFQPLIRSVSRLKSLKLTTLAPPSGKTWQWDTTYVLGQISYEKFLTTF